MSVKNHTILIIDNDNFRKHNLKTSLQTYGYKVKIVQNRNQAVDYLKGNITHVLLSDFDTEKSNNTTLIKDALTIDPS